MNLVYVARHGETTWNVAGRYQGRRESPLSPLGRAQGRALADEFARRAVGGEGVVTRIISSPLGRCTQTARFVAERLALDVELDERLIEIAHGTWEGRVRDEIAANDAMRYAAWRNDPAHVAFEGGESLAEVRDRWAAFSADLPRAGDLLVVTHDAVCRAALLDASRRDVTGFWNVRVENGAFAVLGHDSKGLHVIEECYAGHLATLRAHLEGQAL